MGAGSGPGIFVGYAEKLSAVGITRNFSKTTCKCGRAMPGLKIIEILLNAV
uniref:Uncharacterized protein n=1 Tax=uncultured firmicutes bacterium contig_31 TaxID=1643554 RepID=A0A141GNE7_9FIRM|nr:unknown protein [uncultured firmicutes bacterium contig_31]